MCEQSLKNTVGISQYPRVLVVMMSKVEADDPKNLLIRTQFGDWPKKCLAQIHSSKTVGRGEFCDHYYRLQECDRFLGGMFHRLRDGVAEMVVEDSVEQDTAPKSTGLVRSWMNILAKHLGDLLIHSGLWEVMFRVRLSKPMVQFVSDFKPDLIYCQGYSLGFATLPLLIARRFNIPICFQTTDDWPMYTYRSFPVGWLLRRRARDLVVNAKVRMAFGEKMRQVYEQRYQNKFQVTYHADQFERFTWKRLDDLPTVRSIVFTGGLGFRRYEAISDLLKAIRSMDNGGLPVEICVYCPGIPKEVPNTLRVASEVKFLPLPPHDLLPSVLAQADVLFLPESFSVDPRKIELSISTKCHLYMMSGSPVLAYGPPYSGTIDYGRREGWAEVVTERDVQQLRRALLKLIGDPQFCSQLISQAKEVARRNHDLMRCREFFRQAINGVSLRKADAER
jgi:glycosyltransferase involved in cell wall biosynthesis